MHNSVTRFLIAFIAALSVVSATTGCRTTGWGMPRLSWPSWATWGKDKPPASSIAGTHPSPQPPSVNVPPFESNTPGSSMSNDPSAIASSTQSGPYRTSEPTTGAPGSSRMAATEPYYTGPYATGGNASAATPGSRQGFYSTSQPTSSAAGGYAASSGNPAYGGRSDWSNNTAAGSTPNSVASQPNAYGTASASSPTTGYGSAPTTGYGAAARDAYGSSPAASPEPTGYGGAASYAESPTYGSAPSGDTYGASTGNGYGTYAPTTPSAGYGAASTAAYGTDNSAVVPSSSSYESQMEGAATATADYMSSGGYRPGSTSRTTNALSTNNPTEQPSGGNSWSQQSGNSYGSTYGSGPGNTASGYPSTGTDAGYPATNDNGYELPSTRTATPPYPPTFNR
jgi:hypothetical protein